MQAPARSPRLLVLALAATVLGGLLGMHALTLVPAAAASPAPVLSHAGMSHLTTVPPAPAGDGLAVASPGSGGSTDLVLMQCTRMLVGAGLTLLLLLVVGAVRRRPLTVTRPPGPACSPVRTPAARSSGPPGRWALCVIRC